MNIDRPLPFERRERYDEGRYRESLQRLGLSPPISREDIQRAYRARASRVHPDRFADSEERDRATVKIQEINAAKDYALNHFRGFELVQRRSFRAARNGGPKKRIVGEWIGDWREWAMLPVTLVYGLALVAAGGALGLARLAVPPAWRRWTRRGRMAEPLRRVWLWLAPHAVVLALSVLAGPAPLRVWLAVAFLVMLSADLATLVTGDPNALRRHAAVYRARSLAERTTGADCRA